MRILKYIFLLLLLAFIAASVYVATQRGDYDITKSRVIKSDRAITFNYVNDYRNWENWASWKDSGTTFTYPELTSGKGGSFSWENTMEQGSVQTLQSKDKDSIVQKMQINGAVSNIFWTFKDTVGGTKLSWRVKGKMGFIPKIKAFLGGGVERALGTIYEKSLVKLDQTLDYEMRTYHIKTDGIVQVPGRFYLHQSIRSTVANMPKNISIMMSRLNYFFKKNNIQRAGKSFIIYKTYNTAQGIAEFSVCIPVKEEIYTSSGSDVISGKFDSFRAVKSSLAGDYSHLREAWKKTSEYISKNNLEENKQGIHLELYTVGIEEEKQPSKRVTEIYIPIVDEPVTIVPAAIIPPANPKPSEAIDAAPLQ